MRDDVQDAWAAGEPYERFMGRWSRAVADVFLGWLDAPPGQRWGDVGCGTGALVTSILGAAAPRAVVAIDRSAGFLRAARHAIPDRRVQFAVADAALLPWASGACAAAVSGLALNFVAQPAGAVREMARVTGPGGLVAAYVWDYQDGMQMLRQFWDAAVAVDPTAAGLDEGARFPICQPAALREVFEAAGLTAVTVRSLTVPTPFRDFAAYWSPFLGRQGPAPAYVASLQEGLREQLRSTLQTRLPTAADGSIALTARAWAVRGTA